MRSSKDVGGSDAGSLKDEVPAEPPGADIVLVVQIWNQTKKEMSTYGSTFQSHFNGLRFIVLGMGMISCIRSNYPAVKCFPHRLIDPLQLHQDKA